MNELEIEGKTIESAIEEGLAKLGAAKEQVDIKILNEGSSGLFGLMGNKPAKVRLTLLKCTDTAKNCGPEPDYKLAQKNTKEILSSILTKMKASFTDINTSLLTGRVLAEIKSADSSLIIGRNGQTLDALEMVLNLMLNKEPQTRVKVNLDVEGYRRRQEEKLQAAALKAIEEAVRSGKAFHFEPMSARERRILHMTLKQHAEVESFSEGEGNVRKVVVRPK